tara:strand:- start:1609 stop:3648 length:2040 start_codon:yes stop_codon:yes gene_type:complete
MYKYLFGLVSIILISACKHDFEQPSWTTQWTAPLANSSLSIHQLQQDSTVSWDTLENNCLQLVFQQELFKLEMDSLLNMPGKSKTKNVKLDSISFADIQISYPTTLGNIITDMGATAFLPDGAQAIIPPFPNVLTDTLPIDASSYFEEMTLNEGQLTVSLYNGLPSDLANINLVLRNEGSNSNIIQIILPLLPTGSTHQESVDLSGETLYGALDVEIINVDMVGTNNMVFIDYENALTADILISNIVPFEGIAIFPDQQIFHEDTVVAFDIENAWLTEALVYSGGVSVLGTSTIQDTIKIEYSIPSATLDGVPFELYLELPPAPVGGSVSDELFFDFSGYQLDLTGKYGDTVNTIYTNSSGWIDSSGVLTHISLEDSIFFTLSVHDIKPAFARGYMGEDTIIGNESTMIDLFNSFQGSFDIEQLQLELTTENHIGASAHIKIEEISASNNLQSIHLKGTALDKVLNIDPAVENHQSSTLPVQPTYSTLYLNQSNSNIDELVEIQPNQINIGYELFLNPDQNNKEGFLYKGHGLSADMEISMPLSLIAQDIVLRDTTAFEINMSQELNESSFTLLVENGFPLSANVKLQLLDENLLLLDSLNENTIIEAASIGENGRVSNPVESEIVFSFNNANGLFDHTKNICFEVTFNTEPNDQHIRIFSDYLIKLTLIANHTQNINH